MTHLDTTASLGNSGPLPKHRLVAHFHICLYA